MNAWLPAGSSIAVNMMLPALVWIAWRTAADRREQLRALIGLVLVCSGIGLYSLYVYQLTGDPLEWVASIKRWGYHPGGAPWDESVRVETPRGDVEVRAIQVKHWGARLGSDTHRGYNGYIIRREGRALLFGGDTAYTPLFASHRRHGPFDAAIM